MCGIAGFLNEDARPFGAAVLRRMVDTMHHRGPDETRVLLEANAGLGHARLSIIDLTGGSQPMCNEDGSLWIVFNGEIYNYLELRSELAGRGHRFRTRSDTEVILHLYEDFGADCVSRLNGQWAFAILDRKDRSLFLSRDRFGVRPLFFTWAARTFVFASEIKALFAYPGVRRELDLPALQEIFSFWHTLPPRTAFRDISEVPPGSSALVANGRMTIRRYWDIEYNVEDATQSSVPEREAACGDQLLALLEDATRLRLRADVPVAAYLSGGLDSTLIAALIKRSGIAQLATFSVRFDDADLDEGVYQDEAIRHLGTEHRAVQCSHEDIRRVFPEVVRHVEKPILRTAPAPFYILSRLVREHGYKVVLTGEGSDELLGGYDIFKEAKIRAFWAAQPASRLRPLLLKKLYPYMPQIQSQPATYLKAFFHVTPEDTRNPFFSHLPRWNLTAKLQKVFSDDVRAELSGRDPLATMDALMPAGFDGWGPFTRAEYLETRHLLPGYILSSQGDRVTMAHSVEGRFPFLDYRIAEFAARLSPLLKMKVLNEKYLLKRCARGLVPPSILLRPKQPYRAPDAGSFFGGGRRDYVDELLSPERISRDNIFNATVVERLVDKARKGNIVGVADNMAVVGILSTQLLLDQFITRAAGDTGDSAARARSHSDLREGIHA